MLSTPTIQDETLTLLLRQLDATPDDRHLLLVIADRCDEVDGTGEGWRALYNNGFGVWVWLGGFVVGWLNVSKIGRYGANMHAAFLPTDWFLKLRISNNTRYCQDWEWYTQTVSVAYECAAQAFLRLPDYRRAELLTVKGD
jgi:hypothetical protein